MEKRTLAVSVELISYASERAPQRECPTIGNSSIIIYEPIICIIIMQANRNMRMPLGRSPFALEFTASFRIARQRLNFGVCPTLLPTRQHDDNVSTSGMPRCRHSIE